MSHCKLSTDRQSELIDPITMTLEPTEALDVAILEGIHGGIRTAVPHAISVVEGREPNVGRPDTDILRIRA